MALQSLEDVYVDQIADLYSAERQLVDALPKVAKAATVLAKVEPFGPSPSE